MSLILAVAAATMSAPAEPHPVYELRQYKLVSDRRDSFVELFEREFIEPQEAEGVELIGQFRDSVDQDRFTWIRGFPDMGVREKSLTIFYSGPTWQAHRNTANGMMVDSDNVLLLRAAWPGSGFAGLPARTSGAAVPGQLVVATIHYLWARPDDGFTTFFKDKFAPALNRAGITVDAALVREEAANNFPRLPVREGEKLFVWITRLDMENEAAWNAAFERLGQDPAWPSIKAELDNLEERPAQRLLLVPTPRSKLR